MSNITQSIRQPKESLPDAARKEVDDRVVGGSLSTKSKSDIAELATKHNVRPEMIKTRIETKRRAMKGGSKKRTRHAPYQRSARGVDVFRSTHLDNGLSMKAVNTRWHFMKEDEKRQYKIKAKELTKQRKEKAEKKEYSDEEKEVMALALCKDIEKKIGELKSLCGAEPFYMVTHNMGGLQPVCLTGDTGMGKEFLTEQPGISDLFSLFVHSARVPPQGGPQAQDKKRMVEEVRGIMNSLYRKLSGKDVRFPYTSQKHLHRLSGLPGDLILVIKDPSGYKLEELQILLDNRDQLVLEKVDEEGDADEDNGDLNREGEQVNDNIDTPGIGSNLNGEDEQRNDNIGTQGIGSRRSTEKAGTMSNTAAAPKSRNNNQTSTNTDSSSTSKKGKPKTTARKSMKPMNGTNGSKTGTKKGKQKTTARKSMKPMNATNGNKTSTKKGKPKMAAHKSMKPMNATNGSKTSTEKDTEVYDMPPDLQLLTDQCKGNNTKLQPKIILQKAKGTVWTEMDLGDAVDHDRNL